MNIDPCFVCEKEIDVSDKDTEEYKFFRISAYGNICIACNNKCRDDLDAFHKEGWKRIESFINELRQKYREAK